MLCFWLWIGWKRTVSPVCSAIWNSITTSSLFFVTGLARDQVFWRSTSRRSRPAIAMSAQGVTHVIECGPGKALSGMVKRNAPELLRAHFMKRSWQGEHITFSGVTDCYQPLEASYGVLTMGADNRIDDSLTDGEDLKRDRLTG